MTVQTFPMNTLRFDPEACTGCGMCLEVCPHGVFELQGDIVAALHGADCMECGACRLNCPTDAIQVDSGVGCAGAMIRAALLGQKEATCG
jgi:NAD-dependent dihydropyrimidine dehydrogenase PreA subunit